MPELVCGPAHRCLLGLRVCVCGIALTRAVGH